MKKPKLPKTFTRPRLYIQDLGPYHSRVRILHPNGRSEWFNLERSISEWRESCFSGNSTTGEDILKKMHKYDKAHDFLGKAVFLGEL